MFIALDESGDRVVASNAVRDMQYHCPVCGSPVILRSGLQNADHFAHVAGACADSWNYDMSEWHLEMQNFFPSEAREVVVKHNGIVHRADILIDNTVIEMQHSPITAEEFNDRNKFFQDLGYRIAWVFDVRDKMENDQIQYLDEETTTKLKWNHPMRIFDVLNKRLSDHDKTFAIYLHLYDDEYDDEAPCIYRVVWTKGDDTVDFSRFAVSEEGIDMGNVETSDEFFLPLMEKRKLYIHNRIGALKQEAAEKCFSYSVKYIGEKGKSQSAYTCARTNSFGLKWSGESACIYCKHCAMTIGTQESGRHKLAIYCCYPYTYREPDELAHPGYECFEAEQLLL